MSHAKLTLEMRVVSYPEPNSGFEPQTLASVCQTVEVEFDGSAPTKFGENVNAKISECRPAFTHLLAYLESFFSGRKPFPPENTVSMGESQFRSLVNMLDAGKLIVPKMQITPEDVKGYRDVIITVKQKK
jgi:hypothetical protein